MSASVKFLKTEAGQQSAFDSAATPNIKLPLTGEYEDAQEEHVAEFDQGQRTALEIVEQVGQHATFTLSGTAFFELIALAYMAGNDDITPTGVGPYIYDDDMAVAAVGTPLPWTFLFGGNENLGATGPAVKIINAYCQSFTVSGNLGMEGATFTSTWFGSRVDDNSGAGYAFAGAALPAQLNMVKSLKAGISLDDAGATGGVFTTMTALSCAMLDWSITVNFGIEPKWSTDSNRLTFCGVRFNEPSVEFSAGFRTTSTNYGLIKAKADARTYQELLFTLSGNNSAQWINKITGRFMANFTAHSRANDEVVMNPTFRAGTPYTQTTTPHFYGWELDTGVSL